jgi:hypothetical protein
MQYKKTSDYVENKKWAYSVLRSSFPDSEIYIVNKRLIIIDGQRYTLCEQTQYYVLMNDEYRVVFGKPTLAIQKAFRILRGNAIYSNL